MPGTRQAAILSPTPIGFSFFEALPAAVTYSRTGVATAYTVAGGVTSFVADAAQVTDRGLLLEATGTNLQTQSGDGTLWTASGVTRVESGSAYLPSSKRVLITDPGAAGAFNRILSPGTISIASGTTYTVKIWYELGTSNAARFLFDGGGTTGMALSGGSWSAGGVALGTMALVSDGVVSGSVRRAVLSLAATGSATATPGFGPNATGTDETVIFHGMDIKASAPTSYIPTGAAAVTRGTPTVTVPVPAGRTRWRSVHYDGTTASGSGLTPGATFDIYSAITGAGKGGVGQELRRLEFIP